MENTTQYDETVMASILAGDFTAEQYEEQVRREGEFLADGHADWIEQNADKQVTDRASGKRMGVILYKQVFIAFDEWINTKMRGRQAATRTWFLECGLTPEQVCLITVNTLLDSSNDAPVQAAALRLTQNILDAVEYKNFKEKRPDILSGIERKMDKDNKVIHAGRRRTNIMRAKRDFAEIPDISMDGKDRLKYGMKMIELMIEATGMYSLKTVRKDGKLGVKNTYKTLRASQELIDHLSKWDDRDVLRIQRYAPSLIAPKDWTDATNGGYYSEGAGYVLIRNGSSDPDSKFCLETTQAVSYDPEYANLSAVLPVINSIQRVPWGINDDVYKVASWAMSVEFAEEFAGLHTSITADEFEERILTPKTWGVLTDDEWKVFKADESNHEEIKRVFRARSGEWDNFMRRTSRRVATERTMRTACTLRGREFFFPYFVDTRGRLYPAPSGLSPQGDGLGKGLLTLAQGKALGSDGMRWLQIHAANTFGEDKITMDQRVEWAGANLNDMLAYAENPYDNKGWAEASSPFCFLAVCFEMQKIVKWLESGGTIETFVSNIPVQLDGSCNGSQHYAAILRDVKSAKAVNVLPSEMPQDVYKEVAIKVAQVVLEDMKSGVDEATVWHIAGIDRDTVKRNTMTVPYAVSKRGMQGQILSWVTKKNLEGKRYLNHVGETDDFKCAQYLAEVNYHCIGLVLTSAYQGMEFLQSLSDAYFKQNDRDYRTLRWRTPSGFPVIQKRQKWKAEVVNLNSHIGRVQLTLAEDTKDADPKAHKRSVAPNYVHSMDAAHMFLTIAECKKRGVTNFSMIHDSFGTTAGDMSVMLDALRSQFIKMYADSDVLADFKAQVIAQSDVELEDLPDVPKQGSLDVRLVSQSDYFFA